MISDGWAIPVEIITVLIGWTVFEDHRITTLLTGLLISEDSCIYAVLYYVTLRTTDSSGEVYSPDLLCNLQQLLPLDLK